MVDRKKVIEELSLYHWIKAPAGTSGETLIYKVPPGQELEIELLEVYFPTGCEGLVEARLTHDRMQLYPATGRFLGDEVKLVITAKKTLASGGNLMVEWVNNDTLHELAFSLNLSCIAYSTGS